MKTVALAILWLIIITSSIHAQVLVSEFLIDPKAPLESEWLELYNCGDRAVDLSGWTICDLVGCGKIDSILIDPGEYLVLCQNSDNFLGFYPNFDGKLAGITGWRALNNDGDMILLVDREGDVIDSILYGSGNGGNISWERTSFERPGWDVDNWYACLDNSGSTPGKANSIQGGFPTRFSIELVDKLFSPGCGCPDDLLAVNIELPRNCRITLSVYSLDGRKLKTIFDDLSVAPGLHYYDGTDSNGGYLNVGMYIFLAQVSGECSGSKKLVFGVAK